MAKKYTLNEYYQYSDNYSGARIEVYPDNTIAGKLLAKHVDSGFVEVNIADCINDNSSELPLPNDLITVLDKKFESESKPVIVTGIDTYLFLLNHKNKDSFMIALRNRLDMTKYSVTYLISSVLFDNNHFKNPKYCDSLSIVYISGEGSSSIQETVTVLPSEWSNDDTILGWKNLLKKMGKYIPSESYTISLLGSHNVQAGLSDNIIPLFDLSDIAEKLYGIPKTLPESTILALLNQCKLRSTYCSIKVLEELFGKENANPISALKRLIDLRNDDIWRAYIWYLKKVLNKETYIYQILSDDEINNDNLLHNYIITSKSLLSSDNAEKFQEERKKAIKELGNFTEPLIIEFIQYTKEEPNSITIPWLNCDSKSEHIEIIRRIAKENLDYGISSVIEKVYCALSDYLTSQFDYPEENLTNYFYLYRKQRISEMVSKDFVKRAYEASVPATIEKRDSVLNEFKSENDTALLTVDGMGAEYYPLILSMAKRSGISVAYKAITEVRLPSSTKYNNISWNSTNNLQSVYEIDTISHVGEKKHENSPYEANLAATLDEFNRIINIISGALNTYPKVVLTADHGSSRLAVVAYEKGYVKTLDDYKNPDDWRYMVVPNNKSNRPDDFEASYDADQNKTYWIVKGYNRLPKKGKTLSFHGGATLEERLVPVIVFARDNKADINVEKTVKPVEQIIEKAGFDDI